jgi:hypothetical protein
MRWAKMAPLAPVTPRIRLLAREDSEEGIEAMLTSVFGEVKEGLQNVLLFGHY